MDQQPMPHPQPSRSDTFFKYVKNIFILLLVLQFAPIVLSNLKNVIEDSFYPKVQVGMLTINGAISNASYYEKRLTSLPSHLISRGLL